MDFVSGLVVFILLWWWVFLMSLPFGIKTPDEVESGHATSAPERPMLRAQSYNFNCNCIGSICDCLLDY